MHGDAHGTMVDSDTKSTITMQGARPGCAQQNASTCGCAGRQCGGCVRRVTLGSAGKAERTHRDDFCQLSQASGPVG